MPTQQSPTLNSKWLFSNSPSQSDPSSPSKMLSLKVYEQWAENESLLESSLIFKESHFISTIEHQEGVRNKPYTRE